MEKKEILQELELIALREKVAPGVTDEIMRIMILGGRAIRDKSTRATLNTNAERIFKDFLNEHSFDDFIVSMAIADTSLDSQKQDYGFYSKVMLKLLGSTRFELSKFIFEMDGFNPEWWKRKHKIDYFSGL